MHQWIGSALLQIMACRLFGAKPLSEPMLAYCQLDSWEQISVKSEFYHFHSRKCIWKCRLPIWQTFCPGGVNSEQMAHAWKKCSEMEFNNNRILPTANTIWLLSYIHKWWQEFPQCLSHKTIVVHNPFQARFAAGWETRMWLLGMLHRRQAIFWTNAIIFLIGLLGTNFTEISIEIHTFSFKKFHLKMSSWKWQPFCLGLNVLRSVSKMQIGHWNYILYHLYTSPL